MILTINDNNANSTMAKKEVAEPPRILLLDAKNT